MIIKPMAGFLVITKMLIITIMKYRFMIFRFVNIQILTRFLKYKGLVIPSGDKHWKQSELPQTTGRTIS